MSGKLLVDGGWVPCRFCEARHPVALTPGSAIPISMGIKCRCGAIVVILDVDITDGGLEVESVHLSPEQASLRQQELYDSDKFIKN